MTRDLSGLGKVVLPNPSDVLGTNQYLKDYNAAYARLAKGLCLAFDIIRKDFPTLLGKDEKLGHFHYQLGGEGKKEPLTLEVKVNERFNFPGDGISPYHVEAPEEQFIRILLDLNRIRESVPTKSEPNRGPRVRPYFIIAQHIKGEEFRANESMSLRYNDGYVLHTWGLYNSAIDPSNIQPEATSRASAFHEMQRVLTEFENRESGILIPVAYNRLALIEAVVDDLAARISKGETMVKDRRVALENLRADERVAQPDLFPS